MKTGSIILFVFQFLCFINMQVGYSQLISPGNSLVNTDKLLHNEYDYSLYSTKDGEKKLFGSYKVRSEKIIRGKESLLLVVQNSNFQQGYWIVDTVLANYNTLSPISHHSVNPNGWYKIDHNGKLINKISFDSEEGKAEKQVSLGNPVYFGSILSFVLRSLDIEDGKTYQFPTYNDTEGEIIEKVMVKGSEKIQIPKFPDSVDAWVLDIQRGDFKYKQWISKTGIDLKTSYEFNGVLFEQILN